MDDPDFIVPYEYFDRVEVLEQALVRYLPRFACVFFLCFHLRHPYTLTTDISLGLLMAATVARNAVVARLYLRRP